MESDFLGKKLIVIGGTSGIGKAVASVVLRNGGSVMVVGRRDDKTKAATVELGLRGEVSGWTGVPTALAAPL
jgi:NAD(P)-dependent dehydrogenase (short-subunit alcohol dehydrogenase family)